MEQIIIICLLIIIILMLSERKFSTSIPRKEDSSMKMNIPSIMGETREKERLLLPIVANERQGQPALLTVDNFDSETKEELLGDVALRKSLDDILIKNDELEQEDEDGLYENSIIESGFATGVTFQELSTVGQLLQQDLLEADLEQQAVEIIQKIQGTELFDLLENSLGEASNRIGSLLRESIPDDDKIISSKRSNSSDSFDIGEFV
ncbi:hypothetical protein [Chryseobacterium cucumeris]|uniref:hypothetical protein n=1 Tax=Chryseobacterium cucumeris TaxID=1813611 RepID=UPI0023F3345A|nr:hypothetical protein [Chryseobacterium cucumeris]